MVTTDAPPALVEITRGDMVESRHTVSYAVVDASGSVLMAGGERDRVIYARSAIKPVQALALVETGAADAFGLNDREIALACASHSGEPDHVAGVRQWLAKIGGGEGDLECGSHRPVNQEADDDLVRSNKTPGPLHNNCSGKHAGFLTVARHLGHPTAGYIRLDHPVQQRVLGILEQMTGCDLGSAPRGTDGCGIPVIGIPLGNVALAMAQLADPVDQPEDRQAAAGRILTAMHAEPYLVAGTGRFDTSVMQAAKGRAIVKTGAEGVHCAALIEQGVGIALKTEDGSKRAAEAMMAHLLRELKILDDEAGQGLADILDPVLRNHAGADVGRIRIAASNGVQP